VVSVPPPKPACVTTSIGFEGNSSATAVVATCPKPINEVIINAKLRNKLCIFF
jgi:hypothetical protein